MRNTERPNIRVAHALPVRGWCLAPSTTRSALHFVIGLRRYPGAAASVASFTSMRQRLRFDFFPTPSTMANRKRPSELQPLTQYAASRTSTPALSLRDRSIVASLRTSSCMKSCRISARSVFSSGQKEFPSGMLGLLSLIRSSARCFQVRRIAFLRLGRPSRGALRSRCLGERPLS